MKKQTRAKAPALLAVLALGACTAGQTGPPSVTVPSNPLSGKLQIAVGTANIYGTHAGLNVVVTFRQPGGGTKPGDSAALVSTPSLTLPTRLPRTPGSPDQFGATVETGPTAGLEAGKFVMQGTPQQNPGAPSVPPSTFGVSGGAFGMGLFPGNYTAVGSASVGTGVPDSLVPWTVPLYDQFGSSSNPDPNAFVPWGGPPAFDPDKDGKGTRDGTGYDPSVLGVSEGLDVFAGIVPTAGTYSLAVLVPSNQGQSFGTVKASTTMNSTALLPVVAIPTPKLDANGGGTFDVTLPPGVAQAYVQITDIGVPSSSSSSSSGATNCNSASAFEPVYYTLHAVGSGTVTLPDTDGPGSVVVTPVVSTPSLCTAAQNTAAVGATTPGDTFIVQTIGFDYPAYSANYPMSLNNPAPVIAGSNGQADISISPASQFTSGSSSSGSAVRRAVPWRTFNVSRPPHR